MSYAHIVVIRPGQVPAFCLAVILLAVTGCTQSHTAPVVWKPDRVFDRARLPAEIAALDIEHEEASYLFRADGTKRYRYRVRYRVLNDRGLEKARNVRTRWAPWYQRQPKVKVRIDTPDGASVEFDESSFTISPVDEPPRLEMKANLPAIAVGSVVETIVEKDEHRPFFSAGSVGRFNIGGTAPVRRSRLILQAEEGVSVGWQSRGFTLSPGQSVQDGLKTLIFEAQDVPPIPPPRLHLPQEQAEHPHVAFSSAVSWGAIASAYHKRIEAAAEGLDVARLIRGLKKDRQPVEELVQRLLLRLHENVDTEPGSVGERVVGPAKLSEVVAQGEGTSEDKSALLVAMLRALDVPAELALVRGGYGEDVNPELPGVEGFDRTLVVIPGNVPLYVDASDRFVPHGRIPAAVQGRWALWTSETKPELQQTPELKPEENTYTEVREVFFPVQGSVRVVERSTATGTIEHRLRKQFARTRRSGLQRRFERYVKNSYKAESLGRFDMSVARDLGQPFTLTAEAKGAAVGYTGAEDARIQLRSGVLFTFLPPILRDAALGASRAENDEGQRAAMKLIGSRSQSFILPEAYRATVRFALHPPTGYQLTQVPAPVEVQLGPARWRFFVEDKGDRLDAVFTFDTGPRRMTAEQARKLVLGLARLFDQPITVLTLHHEGAKLVSGGKWAQGIEAYQRAADTGSALDRSRYAEALMRAKLGFLARPEAERAVEQAPTEPMAWSTLGWVLQHDPWGRAYGAGFDRAGAIKAYERVLELDPNDFDAYVNLALLLERDTEGRRYGDAADLTRAVKVYRQATERTGRHDHDANLVMALMASEDWKGLIDMAETARIDDAAKASFQVVGRAMLEGASSAVRALTRAEPDPSIRLTALRSAVPTILRHARYAAARDLLAATLPLTADRSAVEARLELLSRVKSPAEVVLERKDPRRVVQDVLLASFADFGDPEDAEAQRRQRFTSLVTKTLPRKEREVVVEALIQASDVYRRGAERSGLPAKVARDHVLSLTRLRAQSDGAGGHRIEGVLDLESSSRRSTWYVVDDGDQFRLLGLEPTAWVLGRRALTLVKAGKLGPARRTLAWADQDAPTTSDPLESSPFAALWRDTQGADEVRRGAALLLAFGPRPQDALRQLTKARQRATTQEETLHLDHALFVANLQQKRPALALARRLYAAAPDSPLAYRALSTALRQEKLQGELAKKSEERLERKPSDADATRVLANLALENDDVKTAHALLTGLVQKGGADAVDMNNLAWWSLFLGPPSEADLRLAVVANERTRFSQPGHLHTLAALYAERGDFARAWDLLVQRLSLRGASEPAIEDWYLVGRVFEALGFKDEAKKAYNRVKTPGERYLDSTQRLAERRLEQLAQ